MALPITWSKASLTYSCGNDYHNVGVFNFTGPAGGRLSAYSCNMNIDLDGDPQAYGPLSKPALRPMDNLGNAGFLDATKNAARKADYEAKKAAVAALEKQKAELIAKIAAAAAAKAGTPGPAATPPPTPAPTPGTPAKTPVDPAVAKLDEQIKAQKAVMAKMSYEHKDANDNKVTKNPKNFETIFWKWYGVHAMTPTEAKNARPHLEMMATTLTLRKPQLDTTAAYEDVFGRFPVVQSIFEPGTDYFVSPIKHDVNAKYPDWDQRHYLPHDVWAQTAFGALSTGLQAGGTKLTQGDTVFAVRLDTTDTLSFPFRDVGYGYKVAECSFATFVGLGGVYHPENAGAAKFPNNFLLLYLAFPNKKSPASVLSEFATAPNADDFPVMLSFIAKASNDARASSSGGKTVSADPIANFAAWQKAKVKTTPPLLSVITQGLGNAGSTFVQRLSQKYGSVLGSGNVLTPPTRP